MSKRSKLVQEWAEAGAIVSIGVLAFALGLLIRFRWFFLAVVIVLLAWSALT